MARAKAKVQRIRKTTFVPTPGHRIGKENILSRRLRNTRRRTKKKNVRRRTIYVTEKRRLRSYKLSPVIKKNDDTFSIFG